ncbi:ABC transporter permease [Streptomyces sp. HPF1205]|uniref:ABC transporter permease n=1 Tax=Streptomyces sp. HPF1205 TaxID=2873262 RepID=UPI001CEC5FF1|nr:ABC transporter permease [Streptomyces sp. HPF1205]
MSRAEPEAAAPDPAGATGTEAAPASVPPAPVPPARAPRLTWSLGLFGSELVTVFRRWRTLALLAVLAAVPVLVGIAVRVETHSGDSPGGPRGDNGPAFIEQVSNNGLFLTFAALAATLPFFLPMAIGVVAGDSVAGEASTGTLRYLLVAPAGRTRLLLAKYASVLAFCLAATLVVTASALAVGFALFPVGDVTLLSGTTIPLSDGLLRALLIAVLVAASLIGVGALGLFISTVTDSGIGAMAATVGLLITVQIIDNIPQLHAFQPYLFPHYWLSFADILRDPVPWDGILKNLGLQGLYAAVFGSAAWARFTSRDVTA